MKLLLLVIRTAVTLWALAIPVFAMAESLPFYSSEEFAPQWIDPTSEELESFHQIPSFSLTNQDGDRITDRSFENKIYVAGFFFSTCPGICPTIQSKLSKVQEKFLGHPDVRILQHSIQPSTDTVDVLKAYADKNEINSDIWHLLTGDKEQIYNLAKSAYFASDDLGNEQNFADFLHTESLLLIDSNRHIRGIYNGLNSTSVGYLMQDMETLIAEMDASLVCH